MGQITFPYPGGQWIRLTGSSVPLTFDGVTPLTYPQELRRETTFQAAGGPVVLSFADADGNTWSVSVIVPLSRTLIVDPAAAEVATTGDAATVIDGGTP